MKDILSKTQPSFSKVWSISFADAQPDQIWLDYPRPYCACISKVSAKINYSVECINKQLANGQASTAGDISYSEPSPAISRQILSSYLSDVEGLKGVELSRLGSFLRTSKGDNLLGNLYRMTTSDGNVKWVCLDRYRTGYQEAHILKLREKVKGLGG